MEETVGMTALGSPVSALEIGADGTLFVGTEDFLVVRTAAGVRIDVDGLVPTALRLEEGAVAGLRSDLLGIDEATGLAYFIDPVDGDILLLNARTSFGTNVIDVSFAARSTTARRLAIGR